MSEEYLTQEEVDQELHECARYGELDVLKEMKASDDTNMLNFNALDAQGNSALHKAAANGHIDMLSYLKEMGTIYSRNTSGKDPLTWAILNQQLEAVKWFIANFDKEIDVLFKPEFGLSALSTAHDIHNDDIIEVLLHHTSTKALEDKNLEVDDDSDEDDDEDEQLLWNESTPNTNTTTTSTQSKQQEEQGDEASINTNMESLKQETEQLTISGSEGNNDANQ